MRILKNELYKIFGNKIFCAVLLGLILLNCMLLYQKIYMDNDSRSYSPSSYTALYSNLESMDSKGAYNKVSSLYKQMEVYNSLRFLNQDVFTLTAQDIQKMYPDYDIPSMVESYQQNRYLHYTNQIEKELALYQDVLKELKSCIDYQKYLKKIEISAKNISTIPIFADSNSYLKKNIQKTVQDFVPLKDHKLSMAPSKGINLATDFEPTNILGLFLMLIIVSLLIMVEKENSLNVIIKTYYHGHSELAIAKLLAIIFSSVVVVTLFYGCNYFLAYNAYGFGDLHRYIQSIYGFMGSSLSITVFQYLFYFFVAKFAVYILFATILYLITNFVRNALSLYTGMSVILGIELLLYFNIDSAGHFAFFKYCNLYSFLNTHTLFSKYININLFGLPVNYITIFILTHCILVILCGTLGAIQFSNQQINTNHYFSLSDIFSKRITCFKIKLYKTTNLFHHECYKIFIMEKALFLLCIFLILMFIKNSPVREHVIVKDANYYKEYTLKYEGVPSEEKKRELLKENDSFERKSRKIMDSSDSSSRLNLDKLQNIVDHKNVISRILQKIDYLEKQGNGWILYDSGYHLLTGDVSSGNADFKQAFFSIFLLICCLTPIYTMEYASRMNYLLQATYKGKTHTFFVKMILSTLIITIVYGLIYGTYFYDVFSTFGTSAIHAPANSLQQLSNIPNGITILQYLIMISVMRFTGMILCALLIFFISSKMKSFMKSMLICIGLFLLPVIFSLIGLNWFTYVFLNPLFKGNIFC